MRFKEKSLINLVTLICTGLSSIAMAAHGLGVWSLVYGGLLGSLLTMIMLFRVTRWWPKFKVDAGVVRRHGGFGFLTTVNEIVGHFQ